MIDRPLPAARLANEAEAVTEEIRTLGRNARVLQLTCPTAQPVAIF